MKELIFIKGTFSFYETHANMLYGTKKHEFIFVDEKNQHKQPFKYLQRESVYKINHKKDSN